MAGVAYRQIQDDNDGWVLRTPLQGGEGTPIRFPVHTQFNERNYGG